MRTTNSAWQEIIQLFELELQVDTHGYARVSASQLNEFRQARLMAKFDHRSSLPEALASRGWSVIGISNSEYVVGPFEIYKDLPSRNQILRSKFMAPRDDLETLNPAEVASEADAILLAHAAGILDDFIGEVTTLTTFGRMRSETFEFTVANSRTTSTHLTVSGTQIEIDGGFEGDNSFTVVECKNHQASDFNLRQLYYPYRAWSDRISKAVIPVFMTHLDGVFDLYKYDFEYPDDINSGVLVDQARYSTNKTELTLQVLLSFAEKVEKIPFRGVPFPQADNFARVLDLVSRCETAPLSLKDIANIYDFTPRQAAYYSAAGKFLGLLCEVDDMYQPTEVAIQLSLMSANDAKTRIAEILLSVEPIAEVFLHGNRYTRAEFDIGFAARSLGESEFGKDLVESTLARRAKTIVDWCKWLDGIVQY